MPQATVLIADDHPLVLELLVDLLKDRFDVVGTAVNGDQLIEATARLRPDVVVTDISMPALNGLEALRRLKTAGSATKIIVLTMDAHPELARHAIRSGASGFIAKHSAGSELVTAINEVLRGRVYVSRPLNSDVCLPEVRKG
jgi:DNA-binding NarL/FixJ family response regulator